MNLRWQDIFVSWAENSDFLNFKIINLCFLLTIINPQKCLLIYVLFPRKMAARNFDIKHVLLPYLWTSQFTFKGAIWPNLVSWNVGVIQNFAEFGFICLFSPYHNKFWMLKSVLSLPSRQDSTVTKWLTSSNTAGPICNTSILRHKPSSTYFTTLIFHISCLLCVWPSTVFCWPGEVLDFNNLLTVRKKEAFWEKIVPPIGSVDRKKVTQG